MKTIYGGYYHRDICQEMEDGIMVEVDDVIVAKHVDKLYYETIMDAVAEQAASDSGESVKIRVISNGVE